MLSAAALLLHAAALGGFGWGWPSPEPVRLPNATLEVRVVAEAAPAGVAAAVDEPPAAAPAPLPERAPVVRARSVRAASVQAQPVQAAAMQIAPPAQRAAVQADPVPLALAGATRAEPASAPTHSSTAAAEPEPAAAPLRLAAASAPDAAGAAADDDKDEAIPSYRTRLPPSMTLRYEVTHGALRGNGELSWRARGNEYELTLEARVAGIAALTQTSRGALDAAGLAPTRFLDKRLGRAPMAANFQRDAGKISYSGTKKEFALRPGAQDRLSWMLQLAGIVAAEPRLAQPGAKVVMFVTGSRGDAGVWVFRCIGPEAIDGPGGSVEAVKFIREPRDPNDTHVQVWLDPKRHDLPLRASQKSGPNDDGYELRLLDAQPAN